MKNFDSLVSRSLLAALGTLLPATALAQAPAPAPPPAAPPAVAPAAAPDPVAAPPEVPPPAAPPPEAAPPPPPPAAAPVPEAAPTPAAEAPVVPAAPEEEKLPSIDVGAWLRVGMMFQGTNPKKLNDQSLSAYGELHLGGKVHKNVSYTLNLNANGDHATAGIMDALIGLDFIDEFHVWAGQMLVPVDRSNFSGPFFMSPWNYPGIWTVGDTAVFALPAQGAYGRNSGATIWGDIEKGTFKYYASMMNLSPGNLAASPLYSGRLAYAAIGKEPGYYGSSTYYGDQDVLALGVGAQYQKDGSSNGDATDPRTDDFSEINADLLAEFKVGESVLTGEAAYYHFGGDYNQADDMFFVLASYLSPRVGVGKIQPMVRYQWAKEKESGRKMSVIDAFVSYVIKGYTLRATAGFQHTNLDNGVKGNAIQIGLQTIQF